MIFSKNLFKFIMILFFVGAFFLPNANLYSADDTITSLSKQGAQVAIHKQTGVVSFIGSNPGSPISVPSARNRLLNKDAAMSMMEAYGNLFGLTDPNKELRLMKESTTADGRSMVRFQQIYKGVPVIAGELIVNMDRDRNLLSIGGEASPALSLSTEAKLSSEEARNIALDAVAKWYEMSISSLLATIPELSIYDSRLLEPTVLSANLVWRIDVRAADERLPVREFVLVDARDGKISLNFNQIADAKNRMTYDTNSTSILPGTLVCNESNPLCTGGIADAVNAHIYGGDTYDFYYNNHGRDSLDNAGMTLISTVRYCSTSAPCPYQNAFWNGTQMVYGAGFSLADDVVAHELTHGVTEHTSGLFYYYQSGAINESFSDVWGEFVDLGNGRGTDTPAVRWQLGEDLPVIGAIRNMKDPTLFSDPDRMQSAFYYTGTADNGGVHTNSGVNNKAAYLMTDGDTFNGKTVTGLGITKVAKIYYEAQTHLMTSGTNYYDLYNYLYQACLNLNSTGVTTLADCAQVRNATDAVQMNLEPTAGFEPIASFCPAGQSPSNIFFDNMESSTKWTFTNLSGANSWGFVTGYAESGTTSLYVQDISSISDSVAAMNSSVLLPANAFLHFKHAFGFETPNYDGGVLEYSINAGTTWSDAGTLYDSGKNYGGIIYNGVGADNPLAGRSAFIGISNGYVSSRYSLNSLAGQSVRFRFREANDSLVAGSLGWVVDDVRIYTCVASNPTANAGADQTVYTGASVTLSGSGTPVPPATIASYAWLQTGGTAVTLSGANTATATFTAPNAAVTLTFQLTVMDSNGLTGTDTVVVTVQNPPAPPGGGDGGGGGGGGGCGIIDDNKNTQPPITGMMILLLPVAWLLLRKLAIKRA